MKSWISLFAAAVLHSAAAQTPANQNPAVGYESRAVTLSALQFPLSSVHLLPGPFLGVLKRDRTYLLSLNTDRLALNFRVNSGLKSGARPLGGWEAPDCELRGHFTGHFLSACALAYAATSDARLKARGERVVKELAACQQPIGSSGYLSAFPEEFFDRVETGRKVWALPLTTETLTPSGGDRALESVVPVPAIPAYGLDRVAVKLRAKDGRPTGRLLSCEFVAAR